MYDTAVLEIKTNYNVNICYKEQLYYQANKRDCYLLQTRWSEISNSLIFIISKVSFSKQKLSEPKIKINRKELFQNSIVNKNIVVDRFVDGSSKAIVKCKICEKEWEVIKRKFIKNSICPNCNPSEKTENTRKTKDKNLNNNIDKYAKKMFEKSNGSICAYNYKGSKERVDLECTICGHKWSGVAHHALARAYCPACRKRNRK